MRGAPKTLLKNSTEFGRKDHPEWRKESSLSALASAEVQHRCSLAMRNKIKKKYKTIKEYCSETDQSYQRISQVLSGSINISITDIGKAVVYLDISVQFVEQYMDINSSKTALAADTFLKDAVGAFYTPPEIASYMIAKMKIHQDSKILEPSFGDGSFLKALHDLPLKTSNIFGCEIDPAACEHALLGDLLGGEQNLLRGSFFDLPITKKFDAIVGNPPYVRLRSLSNEEAEKASSSAEIIQGNRIGEESSLWLPFLIKAVEHAKQGGCVAFVLPYDFTYVKYARNTWHYLSGVFESIEILRIKERIFNDVLQGVVLFLASKKGGKTESVRYRCFETRADLLKDKTAIDMNITIGDIVAGKRVFQEALVDPNLLELLHASPVLSLSGSEAKFHIGYVCGNKDFFHPSSETIRKYKIPQSSLRSSAASSKWLRRIGFRTSTETPSQQLWCPGKDLTAGEYEYIAYGERQKVHMSYKCKKRQPWWRTPGVSIPDAIMSVFGEMPRIVLNDGSWAISNSMLGAYIRSDIEPAKFCSSWYSLVTLLSIELQVHSLGGGVLIAVPREANKIQKLKSSHPALNNINLIEKALRSKNVFDAYTANNPILIKELGSDIVNEIESTIEVVRSWRKH